MRSATLCGEGNAVLGASSVAPHQSSRQSALPAIHSGSKVCGSRKRTRRSRAPARAACAATGWVAATVSTSAALSATADAAPSGAGGEREPVGVEEVEPRIVLLGAAQQLLA